MYGYTDSRSVFAMWQTNIICKELAVFWVIFVVFLLVGGLVTFVAAQNLTQVVHLDVLLWHPPNLPVGLWLIAAFLCGAVALYLVSGISALNDLRKMKALRKQALALEERVLAMGQTAPLSSERISDDDRLSSADTGPMVALPNIMNTPPPDRHTQLSSLSPQRNFRQ
jgi:uncharacterized integral membrane protein